MNAEGISSILSTENGILVILIIAIVYLVKYGERTIVKKDEFYNKQLNKQDEYYRSQIEKKDTELKENQCKIDCVVDDFKNVVIDCTKQMEKMNNRLERIETKIK